MKHIQFIILFSFFYSCVQPKVKLSDTLKFSLQNNGKYSEYVMLLNKSLSGDLISLRKFLQINYIEDASGYDHGFVIIEVLKLIGDNKFSNALNTLSSENKKNVKNYIEASINGDSNSKKELENYKLTSLLLYEVKA